MNFLIAVKPSLPDTGTALHFFLPGLFAIGNSLPERVCPALKGSLLVHPAPIVRKEDAVKIILFFQRDKVIETVIDFSAVDINKLGLSQSKEIGEILDLTLRKENVTRFLRAAIKTTLTLESVNSFHFWKEMEREGFEPSKAEPSDLQSDPFGRSGTSP